MSSAALSRVAVRQSRCVLQRRAQSSTSEAVSSTASKAKEGASEVASKASSGLSKVQSSAGSAVQGVASAAGRAVSGLGGRTGAAIGFVQGLIPPTLYYARVVGELGKIVYKGRGMAPPTMQTVQSYLTPLQNALRNPSSILSRTQQTAQSTAQSTAQTAQTAANNPQTFLNQLRSFDREALTTTGVVAAEVIGFFTIGEIIGRFKLIGYRGGQHGEH